MEFYVGGTRWACTDTDTCMFRKRYIGIVILAVIFELFSYMRRI